MRHHSPIPTPDFLGRDAEKVKELDPERDSTHQIILDVIKLTKIHRYPIWLKDCDIL